ncbi:Hypothetical protein FKW44_012902 [Caligus rogercresseyi]|uniref:Uncharacterized protein n=1 Tax=Caligus rogercresseyi TaxID=217165 RepID=A0A7T8HK44_CALRO|nr:Hypothetical protein FKW44_012902 [Caligus rogercresseyi]
MSLLSNDLSVDPMTINRAVRGGFGVNLIHRTLRNLLTEDMKRKGSQDARKSTLGFIIYIYIYILNDCQPSST